MSSKTFITVVGNLADNPELRFTGGGQAVAKFTVVVNERKRNLAGEWEDGDPSFHNVSAWGQLAENIAETLSKGSRVVVYGSIRQRSWDGEDGKKQYRWEVTADAVGAELSWATAQIKKANRRRDEVAPDDPWATASRTRPAEPVGVGAGAGSDEPPF